MLYEWTLIFVICALPAFGQEPPQKDNKLSKLKQEKVDNFKLRLHKKLQEVNRMRRDLTEGKRRLVPSIYSHLVEVESTKIVTTGCTAQVDGSDIVFVVTSNNVLSLLQNVTLFPIDHFPSYQAILSLQAIENGRAVWLIAQHIGRKGLYSVNMYEFKPMMLTGVEGRGEEVWRREQVINIPSLSLVSATKYGQDMYVAIVPMNVVIQEFKLYKWIGTKLDQILWTQINNGCSGLAIWNIERTVYVALSYASIGRLLIKQFAEHSTEMSTIQFLDVHAHIIKTFEDDCNHYLLCGTKNSVIIYWWTGSTFQPLHSKLFRKEIIDITIHRFAERMLIAVVFQHEVEFLVQDSSDRYVTAGSQSFGSAKSLKSILLWKSGAYLYMLPLFEEKYLLSMYEIHLKFEVSDTERESSLDDCKYLIENLVDKRKDRINEIRSKLKNTWFSSTSIQVSSLTVKGTVISRANSAVRSLNLDTNVSSPAALKEMYKIQQFDVLDMQTELLKSTLKSGDQYIQSNLYFTNLKVHKGTVSKLLNHVNLNEVATSRLLYALRKKGDQVFNYNTVVVNATCSTATTSLLNENKIEDYVLLRPGTCSLTGYVTMENVTAGNVSVSNKINGVNMKNIVLISKTQNILGQKIFNNLTAKSILTTDKDVGEIPISRIKGIVYKDSQNFDIPLGFTPTLNIKGNLNVSLLNGKEISHLHSNSVKKNERGHIRGLKTFKSAVIRGNVTILERINNFTLTNLMTINTDQNITGEITFSKTTLYQNILTDSLNGIDLGSEAVKKSGLNMEIRGVKTFKENLNVSSIEMEERSQIDFFDPSAEESEIVYYIQNNGIKTSVFNSFITVRNIEASNVSVQEKYFPYLKELGNVWLKTTEQNISRLKAGTIKVANLNVLRMNGMALEDVVTVSGEDSINAKTEFTEEISTQTLNLLDGANINYAPGFWNPDVKVNISGNITIENPILEGNLTITGAIKNLDFMYNETNQTVKGKVNFEKIVLKELNSKNLSFGLLNTINITEYYQRSVLLSSKDIRIFNKKFTALTGSALNCSGTLNNVTIDSVVTTDTKQTLNASYQFLDSTSFQRADVKKFFGSVQLENVIYNDTIRNISNKFFNGDVNTTHLTASGNVNDVDITLLKHKAFNKNENYNTVGEKITFIGNLTANEIQVSENGSIDNVDLEELIRLDDTTSLGNLNASTIKAKTVSVKGNVNRCPLTSFLGNALTLKGDTQSITSRVSVNTLKINGNLQVGYLNGADIPGWIVHLEILAKSVVHANVTLENVKTKSIYISKTVNGTNLKFLLSDYVRKKDSRPIGGKKTFQNITVRNVAADTLISSKTCGIDLPEMFKLSMNRSSSENGTFVLSNLTLPGLEAKRITVEGKMNYLKFPEDVVLSNSNEIIEDEVSISSLNASGGLNVTGKVNGIQLATFLEERMTLSSTETILSKLSFENDTSILENCSISGTINNIRLDEIAFQNQTIAGTKNFTQDFTIMSHVNVTGTVNDLYIDSLQKSLALYDRNESLKGVVNFSNLSASSLICGAINGLDVADLYNDTHILVHDINDTLYNFTSDIQSYEDLLTKQAESAENPFSLYSAFELHEVLNFGLIERFLPVYESGTYGPNYDLPVTQMIMWVKDDDPCRKTKSLVADVMNDGTFNVTKKFKGKLFPFILTEMRENVVGFYVQAEHAKGCSVGQKTRIVVMTLYASEEKKRSTIVSPVNATILDVQLLEVQHEIFLILSYSNAGPSERILVYQYEAKNSTWTKHQKFHFQDLASLSIVSSERDNNVLYESPSVYLSVTEVTNPGVTIYEWDYSLNEFIFKTKISTSVSTYATWVDNDHALYLLLAKEMDKIWKDNTWVNVFTEPLEVYTLEEELVLNHTVNVKGVSSLETFDLADETYVLAASNNFGTVYVLQFRGYNGFEFVQALPSPGVTETRVFTVDNHLFLAINSRTGPSKTLKASVRGRIQGLE